MVTCFPSVAPIAEAYDRATTAIAACMPGTILNPDLVFSGVPGEHCRSFGPSFSQRPGVAIAASRRSSASGNKNDAIFARVGQQAAPSGVASLLNSNQDRPDPLSEWIFESGMEIRGQLLPWCFRAQTQSASLSRGSCLTLWIQ